MEKLEKKHHNHSFTECLKNIIFGLVMLAPFLAIAVRCGYVMWNKNAKDSYSDFNEQDNKYINLSNFNDLVIGNTYRFISNNDTTNVKTSGAGFMVVDNVEIINTNLNLSNTTITKFGVYSYQNALNYISVNGTNSYDFRYNFLEFSFTYLGLENINTNNTFDYYFGSMIYQYHISNNSNTLDNAFSYSVSQISNDPIFNWTKNTGIYQPINAMVEGLEIENDTLQILLAYWSLMTAVYIVFDLIIFCFTKITHFING